MSDDLLKPGEAAAMLGVNVKTLTRWANSGKLPVSRTIGDHRRYYRTDIEKIARPTRGRPKKPKIVVLCGSSRFRDAMTEVNRALTMEGYIVLAPGVFGHDGDEMTREQKERLDELHFRKIDMADRVLVVNLNDYIGESTKREIAYAKELGKPIGYTY